MIANSIFLVVVTIGMGALLNASAIHQKSQDMRSIMDNLSFIMEDMSRNIRTGYDYHCIDNGDISRTDPHSCSVDGKGISFKSATGPQWIYQITDNGTLFDIRKFSDGYTSNPIQLNPAEVQLTSDSGFWITGAESPSSSSDTQQPFVTIRLVGVITYKGADTPFSLQTSVSQRQLDR